VRFRTAVVLGGWLLVNPPIRDGRLGRHVEPDALADEWRVAGTEYASEAACERARAAWVARWTTIRASLPLERSFAAYAQQAKESRCLPDAIVHSELLLGATRSSTDRPPRGAH
jgi:hypothetical protein